MVYKNDDLVICHKLEWTSKQRCEETITKERRSIRRFIKRILKKIGL